MNDFGQLASDIITYDFPNDTGTYGTGYISGWLEVNLGELNGLTHEEFSGNATGAIEYTSGSGLMPIEKKIFRGLYELHYYQKSARESLRAFTYDSNVDWITIKEGDTTLQRQNKNSVAKTYRELEEMALERLDNLLYQYNSTKSSPLQVAGTDGTSSILVPEE
tara:strand:+ start:154 stop:645 length:492 start_codon:yes stop_codon:yes gene_type:complete